MNTYCVNFGQVDFYVDEEIGNREDFDYSETVQAPNKAEAIQVAERLLVERYPAVTRVSDVTVTQK